MFRIAVLLLGVGGAVLLSPACKAQEVSPDHFTDTGVQDVYQPAEGKPKTPAAKQKSLALQARKPQVGAEATLQLASKRGAALPAQAGAQPVAEKRKVAASEPKKP